MLTPALSSFLLIKEDSFPLDPSQEIFSMFNYLPLNIIRLSSPTFSFFFYILSSISTPSPHSLPHSSARMALTKVTDDLLCVTESIGHFPVLILLTAHDICLRHPLLPTLSPGPFLAASLPSSFPPAFQLLLTVLLMILTDWTSPSPVPFSCCILLSQLL